ncbi:primosomal protein N' family DNA-binding protein, partial [Actinomyces sp.]
MMSMQGMLDGFDAPAARSAEVARVIVDVDLAHMDRSLDYVVPDALVDQARVGSLVRVRFSGNRVDGWIVERTRREVDDHVGRVESVVSATPVLTPALYEASRRIASRFLATTSQVFSLALPPRHARAEKEELASKPPAWPTIIDKSLGEGWRAYPAGAAFLSRLRVGESPRAIVTALRPYLRACLSDAVAATVASGRAVIVVTPTGEHAARVARELEEDLGIRAALSGGEVSPEERYRVHIAASLGRIPLVVGTRSAVWVPVTPLGLIVILDDGDDRLRERRFPRCDALDVAVQRCAVEGAGLLVASNARSVKAQALVHSGWAVSLDPTPDALRAATPRVHLHGEAEAHSEGAGGHMRIPQAALRMLRQGLRTGPVLIQVAAAGYWPTVVCRRCDHLARCPHCSGPLSMDAGGRLTCGWCDREPTSWRCPQCSGRELRGARVGSSRTAEEIARNLPDASVLE